MFTLIAMGTGVAWIYSVVATIIPESFPAAFPHHGRSCAGFYFEAAAVHHGLVLLGQVLELKARESTGGCDPRFCLILRLRRRGACQKPTVTKRFHSTRSSWVTFCASGPVIRCQLTAPLLRDVAPSMNRW